MDEKYTNQDLDAALDDMEMLKYFPKEARASVKLLFIRMIPHRRALIWLTRELVDHVGEWPGPAEVRGLLCTRYDAADGIDQRCSLPGFTAEENYQRHLEQHQQLKAGGITDDMRKFLAPAKQKRLM